MGLKLGGLFKGLGKIAKLGLSAATGGMSDRVLSVAKTIGTATGVLRKPTAARSPAIQAQIAKWQTVQPRVSARAVLADMRQPVMTRAAVGGGDDDGGAPYGYTPAGNRRGKPCKHGPTTPDEQYPCNKATRSGGAGRGRRGNGGGGSAPAPQEESSPSWLPETPNRSRSRKTIGEKVGDRVIGAVVNRIVPRRRRSYRYGSSRQTSRPPERQPPMSQPSTPTKGIRSSVLGKLAGMGRVGATLATPISALPTAGVLGAALLVGLSSYAATRAVLQSIADKKEREQVDKNNLAMAYRQARLDAAAKLGRPLTAQELASMAAEYKRRVIEQYGEFY